MNPRSRIDMVLAVGALLLVPRMAHAYLDPGTGSYVLQVLIAGVVAGFFTIKLFWLKIVGFFARLVGKQAPNKPSDE